MTNYANMRSNNAFPEGKKHARNCTENIIKQVIKASDNSNNDNVVMTF